MMKFQNLKRIVATIALLSLSSHAYGKLGDSVEGMRALWNYVVFDKSKEYAGWAFGGHDSYFALYYVSEDYTPKQYCSIFNADGKEVFEVFSFEGECSATNMPLAKFLKLNKMQTKPRNCDGILRWDGSDGMAFAIVSPKNKHLMALVAKEYFDGPLCGDLKEAKTMLESFNSGNLPVLIKSLAGVTGNPPETEAEKKAVILAKKNWLNFCDEATVQAEAVWSIPESRYETLLELKNHRKQADYKWVASDHKDAQWLCAKGRWMVVSFEGTGKNDSFLHSFMDFVRDAMSDSTLSEMQGFTMAVTGADLDKFGNSTTKSLKLVAKISRDTASKINWGGMSYERFNELLLSDGMIACNDAAAATKSAARKMASAVKTDQRGVRRTVPRKTEGSRKLPERVLHSDRWGNVYSGDSSRVIGKIADPLCREGVLHTDVFGDIYVGDSPFVVGHTENSTHKGVLHSDAFGNIYSGDSPFDVGHLYLDGSHDYD